MYILGESHKNIGTILLSGYFGSGAEKYKCLVPGVSFDLYLSHMLSKTVVSALSYVHCHLALFGYKSIITPPPPPQLEWYGSFICTPPSGTAHINKP